MSDPAYFKQMGGSNSGPDSVPVDMKGWLKNSIIAVAKFEASGPSCGRDTF